MHGIYHPPYSSTNRITNTKFIEDFSDYVSTSLPNHQNNVFLGDFNLHVSDQLDTDATIFEDTMDALGLYQHIGFPTHKSGNVLDLILSDFTSNAKVLTTATGPFVTNHRAVIATLNIKRLRPATKEILVKQVSKVSVEQWNDEFNPDNVKLNGKLDVTVSSLNTELHSL